MKIKPLVSINILTWNAEKYIKKCLNSALRQSYDNIEINILDNGSKDKTIAITKKIKKQTNKKISIWQNEKNMGFASGHNALIDKSKGDFVLMLNQDAILDNDFVKKAVEEMEKDEKIAAIQSKLIKYDYKKDKATNKFDSAGLLIYRNRRIVNRGQGIEDKGQYEKKEEIFGADGAAPFYRRKALEDVKIGSEYFDENFFTYKEDIDLSWRLRLYGWKIVYIPSILAYHGRGAGESESMKYLDILKQRRRVSFFAKKLSFKNQRLMQIKNEFFSDILKDFFPIFKKGILAWGYTILLEPRVLTCLIDFFRLLPSTLRKRKIIMANQRIGSKGMRKWFA